MPLGRHAITTTPENSETPWDSVRSWVTPSRLFFVRNHFDVPTIDANAWQLTIEGCVDRPLTLSWNELCDLPQASLAASIECAGNGRSFLQPAVEGVQWGAGAIGHAEWTGVPLYAVLEKAGIDASAQEVVFEGADRGAEHDHPETMAFARSLPLRKALDRNTLLAMYMNGEPLDANHGYPVRLLVPGWYGVASVKWLSRIEVIDHAFKGYFQTKKYTVRRPGGDGEETSVVGAMVVKSAFVRPQPSQTLTVGRQRLFGVAWAGEEQVARVDVSTDNGLTWNAARLLDPAAPYSWTFWEYAWNVEKPGQYSLRVRATTADGTSQPEEHDALRGGYMINFIRPTAVEVVVLEPTEAAPRAETLLYDMNSFAETNARLPLDVHLEFSEGGGI